MRRTTLLTGFAPCPPLSSQPDNIFTIFRDSHAALRDLFHKRELPCPFLSQALVWSGFSGWAPLLSVGTSDAIP